MITQEQQMQGAELIRTLAQKAWESSTFKEQLINSPISTIEAITGQPMLPNTKIVVDDQTDASIIYLNIPRKLDIGELELTDEQLEMVSGGTGPYIVLSTAQTFWAACAGAGAAIGSAIANYQNRQDAAAAPKK